MKTNGHPCPKGGEGYLKGKNVLKDVQEEEGIAQIYDKILKRILTLSNVAVVNFINGVFNKNFPTGTET